MNASIIICTRNRASSLDQTLASLESVTIPAGLSLEILVVDNGSTDATSELVQKRMTKQSSLRYVLERSAGLSRARNAGLSQSTGDIIIYTDDDVVASKDWIVHMAGPLMRRQFDALVGRIKLPADLSRPWMANTHKHWLAASGAEPADKLQLIGASMGFHRCVLERIPEFDTELGAGALGSFEETLFSWQLEGAGFRIGEAPEAVVVHHFQKERLLRKNWLTAAEKMGQSAAYVHHHWRHHTASRLHVRLYRTLAQYYFWRILKRRECAATEGIPLWELILLERLHRLRRYIALRGSPRNYEKRGLIKRQPA